MSPLSRIYVTYLGLISITFVRLLNTRVAYSGTMPAISQPNVVRMEKELAYACIFVELQGRDEESRAPDLRFVVCTETCFLHMYAGTKHVNIVPTESHPLSA